MMFTHALQCVNVVWSSSHFGACVNMSVEGDVVAAATAVDTEIKERC